MSVVPDGHGSLCSHSWDAPLSAILEADALATSLVVSSQVKHGEARWAPRSFKDPAPMKQKKLGALPAATNFAALARLSAVMSSSEKPKLGGLGKNQTCKACSGQGWSAQVACQLPTKVVNSNWESTQTGGLEEARIPSNFVLWGLYQLSVVHNRDWLLRFTTWKRWWSARTS